MNLIDFFTRRRPPDGVEKTLIAVRTEHEYAKLHAERVLRDFEEADGIVVNERAQVVDSPRFNRRHA